MTVLPEQREGLLALVAKWRDEAEVVGLDAYYTDGMRACADELEASIAAIESAGAGHAAPGKGAVTDAARDLYMAGRWDCAALSQDEQVRLWERLRDALGLTTGTATAAGVSSLPPVAQGADDYLALADARDAARYRRMRTKELSQWTDGDTEENRSNWDNYIDAELDAALTGADRKGVENG